MQFAAADSVPAECVATRGVVPLALMGSSRYVAPSPSELRSIDRAPKPRVLVAEQDVPLTRFLTRGLETDFLVSVVHDGEAALEAVNRSAYDLVLLDLNQPGLDGLLLLEQLRHRFPTLPLIVLTARKEALVDALEAGADDFMVKPFSFTELGARVRSLLRRSSNQEAARLLDRPSAERVSLPFPPAAPGYKFEDLTLNREEYRVERSGRAIPLTAREFALLEFLISRAGRPFSRATLIAAVWKTPPHAGSNIVDVYMKYLRDKIDRAGEEKLIRTIRGVGYALGRAPALSATA